MPRGGFGPSGDVPALAFRQPRLSLGFSRKERERKKEGGRRIFREKEPREGGNLAA